MANELARVGPPPASRETEDDGVIWDAPPVDDWRGTASRRRSAARASDADRDAAKARAGGDDTFAVLRESDAAEHRQSVWDWGDLRTWAILFALFFGFLLFTAWVYFMPTGRHNQTDGPNSTPAIRVY